MNEETYYYLVWSNYDKISPTFNFHNDNYYGVFGVHVEKYLQKYVINTEAISFQNAQAYITSHHITSMPNVCARARVCMCFYVV